MFYLNEIYIYIYIYIYDNMKIYFDNMKKRWYNENIFCGIQIWSDWMKVYFDIVKKGYIMKIYFIKHKVILIERKYILISYKFLFL